MTEEMAMRGDEDVYCILRSKYMLIIDGVCFSRTRDNSCRNCRYDIEDVVVKLLWQMLDLLEDRETEAQRVKRLREVQQ